MNELMNLLKQYDKNWKENPDRKQIQQICTDAEKAGKPVSLITFTCSTIDAQYMFDKKNYDQYVSLSPEGNNLTDNLQFYREFFGVLSKQNSTAKLVILIGNTDPYYIYSGQLQLLPGVKKDAYLTKMSRRWKLYEENLRTWLTENIPNVNFTLINWYEFQTSTKNKMGMDFDQQYQTVLENIAQYFPQKLFDEEKFRLKNAFGKGKYFETLNCPSDDILDLWIKRKFAEYALQGLWIKLFWPDGILVQNEKPALLRYQMYQPLCLQEQGAALSNIFPFGVSEGYS